LVVVVIIGILACRHPQVPEHEGKANTASLKSDLRNLVTAQEAYLYENQTYTTSLPALNVTLSNGVTITWGTVNAQGWAAKLTHPLAYPIECAMFIGSVPPLPPATSEGQLLCQ
jgi:hypothetical protein